MLEKAKEVTRTGKYTHVEYARFADDMVILIDGYPRHGWLLKAVDKRLREEFAKLHVEMNEEKSRTVDLTKAKVLDSWALTSGASAARQGEWHAAMHAEAKKRTACCRSSRRFSGDHRSQPLYWVIETSTRSFAAGCDTLPIGHSSRCFKYVKHWVEKKVRRHLMRARKRRASAGNRWSSAVALRELWGSSMATGFVYQALRKVLPA